MTTKLQKRIRNKQNVKQMSNPKQKIDKRTALKQTRHKKINIIYKIHQTILSFNKCHYKIQKQHEIIQL